MVGGLKWGFKIERKGEGQEREITVKNEMPFHFLLKIKN